MARCTVARLMKSMGLAGVTRGRRIRTTVPDKSLPAPYNKVNRLFRASAPNRLWVSDFTYVPTWQGFVCVAFIFDVFARRIVGWRVSRSAKTDFVLDALEQALYERRPAHHGELVPYSDRGVQYVSIRYTERLAETGIEPSAGSVGDSYDKAPCGTRLRHNGGNYQRALQSRTHPPSSPLENNGGRRMADIKMGRLVWLTDDCCNPSVTSRQQKQKRGIMH